MFSLIFGIIMIGLILYWIYAAYFAKRLTEMKDGQSKDKIVSNKNIAQNGLMQFYIYPTVIFALAALIYFIF